MKPGTTHRIVSTTTIDPPGSFPSGVFDSQAPGRDYCRFKETIKPEEFEVHLASTGKMRANGQPITFQNITEKERRALCNPLPALNDTTALTKHMREIRWDIKIGLKHAAEKIVHKIYSCIRKAGPPIMLRSKSLMKMGKEKIFSYHQESNEFNHQH